MDLVVNIYSIFGYNFINDLITKTRQNMHSILLALYGNFKAMFSAHYFRGEADLAIIMEIGTVGARYTRLFTPECW